MHTYTIDSGFRAILAEVGVDHVHVLRHAQLPEDLLNGDEVRVPADAFLRFGAALEELIPDDAFWVTLVEAMSPEWFSPSVFAALCSPDLVTAGERLARFKPLMGPITLEVAPTPEGVRFRYRWLPGLVTPPAYMHALEALFIVRLARLGTRRHVRPLAVTVPALPRNPLPFEQYLGVRMTRGESLDVVFSQQDVERPFMTANPGMWKIFEPELRKRLADLDQSATFTMRTRAVLVEALPAGQVSMAHVARRLAVSSRTLQRRLREEGTSFKDVVQATRESLARHYLERTRLSATEVAYLLGFEEATSFFRAFHRWTGTTPEAWRRKAMELQGPPPFDEPPPGRA